MQSALSQSEFSVPCSDRLRAPIERQHSGVPFILSLLKCGFPFAAIWTIVCVWMISAHRMFFARSWPHVRKEISESARPKPAVAHLYSPASVLMVAACAFCVTAVLDGLPRPISIRPDHLPVGISHSVGVLPRFAPATLRVAAHQVHGHNRHLLPAGASAEPSRCGSRPDSRGSFNNEQLSVTVPVQIEFFGHNAIVLSSRRLSEELLPEAQQREGSFRGIPLGSVNKQTLSVHSVNT